MNWITGFGVGIALAIAWSLMRGVSHSLWVRFRIVPGPVAAVLFSFARITLVCSAFVAIVRLRPDLAVAAALGLGCGAFLLLIPPIWKTLYGYGDSRA